MILPILLVGCFSAGWPMWILALYGMGAAFMFGALSTYGELEDGGMGALDIVWFALATGFAWGEMVIGLAVARLLAGQEC
jgi:hypothetical protein